MTDDKPRPLTVPDAGCPNVSLEMFAEPTGRISVTAEDSYGEIDVLLEHEGARRLRDWLTDYLGDEDDTDKTPDDDGWEEVTDWKNDPPRPGDELEWIHTDRDLVEIRRGIFSHIEGGTQVRAREDGLLGYLPVGIWRVRRAPAPDLDPADVLTPGTILRHVKTEGGASADVAQVEDKYEDAVGVWSDGHYGQDTCNLIAFTVESTGDRWETKHGRWTITSAEGIRTELNGGNA